MEGELFRIIIGNSYVTIEMIEDESLLA